MKKETVKYIIQIIISILTAITTTIGVASCGPLSLRQLPDGEQLILFSQK